MEGGGLDGRPESVGLCEGCGGGPDQAVEAERGEGVMSKVWLINAEYVEMSRKRIQGEMGMLAEVNTETPLSARLAHAKVLT